MKYILVILIALSLTACPAFEDVDGEFSWTKASAAGGAALAIATAYTEYKGNKEDGERETRKQGDRIKAGRALLYGMRQYKEISGEMSRPIPVRDEDGRWTVQDVENWRSIYEETRVWYFAEYGEPLSGLIARLLRRSKKGEDVSLPSDMEFVLRAIDEYGKRKAMLPEGELAL